MYPAHKEGRSTGTSSLGYQHLKTENYSTYILVTRVHLHTQDSCYASQALQSAIDAKGRLCYP